MHNRRAVTKVLYHAFVILFGFMMVYPVLWMISGSFKGNAEILRGTLALYDWTESEMNRRRLEAIVDVQHSLIQRFERGFLLRGVDIQVTLDSNGFAGEGDITLFGELLHRFFALYADIHLFTQLTLILQPTGKCLQWTEHHSQRVPG